MRTGCTSGAAERENGLVLGRQTLPASGFAQGGRRGGGVQGPLLPTRAAGPQGGTRRRTSSCHPWEQARGWVPGGVESSRSFPLAPEKPPFLRYGPLVGRSLACRSEPPGTRDLECSVLAPEDCARPAISSPLGPGDGDARRGPDG